MDGRWTINGHLMDQLGRYRMDMRLVQKYKTTVLVHPIAAKFVYQMSIHCPSSVHLRKELDD